MKKFLFSVLTAAFTFTFLQAQQMSYYVDMVGNVGQNFIYAEDTLIAPGEMNLNLGDTGAGVVWNFQGIDLDIMDTLYFVALTGPEATDYPGANIVMESNLGRLIFDKDVANGLFFHGASFSMGGFGVNIDYNPPQQALPAVCSLHSTASTQSAIREKIFVDIDTIVLGCNIVIDSIYLKRDVDFTVNFDATGELRLPLDTFDYTLRAISKEVTLDSIFIYSTTGFTCAFPPVTVPPGWSLAPDILIAFSGFAPAAVVNDSTFRATWYDPYTISPICLVDFDYDSAYVDTNFFTVRFKGNDTPDIGFEAIDQIPLTLYPNPASDLLMLETNASLADATMFIYNAQGQQVRTINLNGSNMINLEGFTNGMYFYQLANGKKLLHHGKFMVKR